MLRRVLVPIDGRAAFNTIMPHVRPLRRCGVNEVVLMHAHSETAEDDAPPESIATPLTAELNAEGFEARSLDVAGAPAEAILAAAKQSEPSLIAMATHGRSGPSRLFKGSVCESVLRAGPYPVLAIKGAARERDEDNPLQHLLVATDGSDRALQVVPWVAAMAKPLGSRVTIVHFASDYAGKSAMAEGQFALEAARLDFAKHGIKATVDLRRGDPVEGLTSFGLFEPARDDGVDLIAMATHGRSGLPRAVLGSVTEKVLRNALVPVLMVRAT